jgi:hypothetical protein
MIRATLLVLWGVVTVALFLPVVGTSEQAPPPGCPPLPGQAPEGTVAVYVAKMPEKPGFVCARAVNGIPPPIGYDGFHFQRREEGQFHDFTEPVPPTPPGVIIGEDATRFMLVVGSRLERQFPLYSPAPPGTYRACFRYTLYLNLNTERQEVCSEELSLP